MGSWATAPTPIALFPLRSAPPPTGPPSQAASPARLRSRPTARCGPGVSTGTANSATAPSTTTRVRRRSARRITGSPPQWARTTRSRPRRPEPSARSVRVAERDHGLDTRRSGEDQLRRLLDRVAAADEGLGRLWPPSFELVEILDRGDERVGSCVHRSEQHLVAKDHLA